MEKVVKREFMLCFLVNIAFFIFAADHLCADVRFKVIGGVKIPILHQHYDQQGHATKENTPGPYWEDKGNPPWQHGMRECGMHPHAKERNSVYSIRSKRELKKNIKKAYPNLFANKRARQAKGKAGMPSLESNCHGYTTAVAAGEEPVSLPADHGLEVILESDYRELEEGEEPQECDLLTYTDFRHTGHVFFDEETGKLMIRSVWEHAGVYIHEPDAVPPKFGKPEQYWRRKP